MAEYNPAEHSYEENAQKLEEILAALENRNGGLSLVDTVEKYHTAKAILKHMDVQLNKFKESIETVEQ